jgi:hypothetical protein
MIDAHSMCDCLKIVKIHPFRLKLLENLVRECPVLLLFYSYLLCIWFYRWII